MLRVRSALLIAAAFVASTTAACKRGAGSPGEAYERLAAAVKAGDAAQLFEALDLETQWAWMTVQRAQREAYDIVLSNFPESERARAIARFEDAALSQSAAELFARRSGAAALSRVRAELPEAAPPKFEETGDDAYAVGRGGARLRFHAKRGWGFGGFLDEARALETRAWTDLAETRTSATDFERALARGGS